MIFLITSSICISFLNWFRILLINWNSDWFLIHDIVIFMIRKVWLYNYCTIQYFDFLWFVEFVSVDHSWIAINYNTFYTTFSTAFLTYFAKLKLILRLANSFFKYYLFKQSFLFSTVRVWHPIFTWPITARVFYDDQSR